MWRIVGYGVYVHPGPRDLDLTPLFAIVTAILLARLLLRLRLSPPTVVGAAFVGALWAYLAEPWGLVIPSIAAFMLIIVVRWVRLGRDRGV